MKSFWLPWSLLAAMLVFACWHPCWSLSIILALAVAFIVMLCIKPMNIIYGLIGTRGDISYFFMLFLLVNFLFASIYYEAFFKTAGVTYDVNHPHVEFDVFKPYGFFDCRSWVPETQKVSRELEHLPTNNQDPSHCYYRVNRMWVLQNTFLTSLMQEPAEFYSISSTYTGNDPNCDPNYRITYAFHWFLIFHILVSWILLGVFISMIYQKFRKT